MNSKNHILIVGAGAFGIALAHCLNKPENSLSLISRSDHNFSKIKSSPKLQSISLQTFAEFSEDISKYDLIIMAVPAQSLRGVFEFLKQKNKDNFKNGRPFFATTSKGIEQNSLKLPFQIFEEIWGTDQYIASLSGPSFAKELMEQLPSCVTLASCNQQLLKTVAPMLHSSYFRIYDSEDIIGVEVGGALKNVIAMIAGAVDGLELGYNARAAVITRGLSEIARVGVRLGANPLTFLGLSGVGDLILTCTGDLSRNRQFGFRLARGESKEAIIAGMGGIIEGFTTAKSAYELINKYSIQSSLLTISYKVLYEDLPLRQALYTLISREQGSEFGWLKQ